ncbi:MAG: hypothetical protein GY919_00290 [Photobacterium aquimaris]|nr:hypothetical protein [Photobacterium aquimaris]
MNINTIVNNCSERSAVYASLASNFRYPDRSAGEQVGIEYNEAFEKSVCKGATSLHEASYITHQLDSLMEELVRFYDCFGLKRNESAETPDHLSVQLEFMHFLTYLEQKACERGEPIDELRKAQLDFLERHVTRLTAGVVDNFAGENPHYQQLLADLQGFIQLELDELKITVH